MAKFRTGAAGAKERSNDFLAYSLLPDVEKERLARTLLGEFGVTQIATITDRGEMIHSCCLPLGGHRNGDANPSASFNFLKLTYNCYGCGHSGGLLWFIATCRGSSSEEARTWLGSQTGIGEEQDLAAFLAFFDALWNPQRNERPPLPKLDPRVLDPWRKLHWWLTEPPPLGRGIPAETLITFDVGFDSEYRVAVHEGESTRWIISERIIIPHWWRGNLVGWQSRRVNKDGTAKYLNSGDFPREFSLYHYEPRRPALVVESPMSVLSKYAVCPTIEATFGAKVTDYQVQLLAEHPRVTLFFDNDEAGWHATEEVGSTLMDYTDVLVVDNPYNADAADLTDEMFSNLIEHPIPFSMWQPPRSLVELSSVD
jgi:Toprim-like